MKATYNYNLNGARESLVYTNGNSEHYSYNLANWLTSLVNKNGNAVVSSYAYAYYADGNQRTKTDHNNRVTTYLYDGVGRLKNESESTGFCATYQYDSFSNRSMMTVTGANNYTMTYSYDANNRLMQDVKTDGSAVITGNYFYDPNGNQIAKATETLAPAGGNAIIGIDPNGMELHEYDGFNRLKWANVNGEEISYTYRADGLRNSKETAVGKTTHMWDGANIVADLNGGVLAARYVRGIGLLMSDSSAGQRFYLYNGHGDVVQLTNTSGAVVKAYDFDAFGVERNPDASDTNVWRYCGEYFDKETGSIYLRTRYYNPATSRFLSEDPIRSGYNFYTYCANNPLSFVDPWGLLEVAARYYAESYGAYVEWTGNYTRNGVTYASAIVSMSKGTAYEASLSITGVLKNGSLMIDDSVLNNYFGWGNPWIEKGQTEAVFTGVHLVAVGNYHSSVIIFAAPGSPFYGTDNFKDTFYDGGPIQYATLGSGSEGGKLISNINRKKDKDLSNKVQMISMGISDVNTINKLFAYERYYNANFKNVNYDLYPDPNKTTGGYGKGYNSNSFATGLLQAAGIATITPSYNVPGFDKPLPTSYFWQPRRAR